MFAMFRSVLSDGWTPVLMAAFSALSPKASKPIGKSTLWPRMRTKRAAMSDGVIAYQWPTCRSPDGYGNIVTK